MLTFYSNKDIKANNSNVKLQIWDISGSERHSCIIDMLINKVDCALICYDCTDQNSFEDTDTYVNIYEKYCEIEMPVFLVATKIDIDNRVVTRQQGELLAKQYSFEYFETSAKENININELFETAVKRILDSRNENDAE